MSAVTFEFKIFDENNSNLLSYADYNSHTQRINGFHHDQEIISSVFNNVLKQCSMITYQIAKYISDTNDVDFEFNMSNQTLEDNITNFFMNFNAKSSDVAKDLDVTHFNYHAIPMIGENGLEEILPTINKSIVFGEYNNFEAKEIVKFNSGEVSITDERFLTLDTGVTSGVLNNYVLELIIIKLDSGNKAFTKLEFDISDLPALAYNIGSGDVMTIYDSGFRCKCFYNLYDGTRRWFYLGMTNSVHSASPSKGQYLVMINDMTEQGFVNCKLKARIKEKI